MIALAKLRGFKVAHFRGARVQRLDGSIRYQTPVQADGAGWPDLILCRPPRLLVVELKARGGRLRPEQQEWINLLVRCEGVQVWTWWPDDWPSIELVLA